MYELEAMGSCLYPVVAHKIVPRGLDVERPSGVRMAKLSKLPAPIRDEIGKFVEFAGKGAGKKTLPKAGAGLSNHGPVQRIRGRWP